MIWLKNMAFYPSFLGDSRFGRIYQNIDNCSGGLKNFKKGVGSDEDNQPPSDNTVIENQEDAEIDGKTKKKRNKEN